MLLFPKLVVHFIIIGIVFPSCHPTVIHSSSAGNKIMFSNLLERHSSLCVNGAKSKPSTIEARFYPAFISANQKRCAMASSLE